MSRHIDDTAKWILEHGVVFMANSKLTLTGKVERETKMSLWIEYVVKMSIATGKVAKLFRIPDLEPY